MWLTVILGPAQVKPTHVLNAAGLTGRPNVDWCEDHKVGVAAGCHVPAADGVARRDCACGGCNQLSACNFNMVVMYQ